MAVCDTVDVDGVIVTYDPPKVVIRVLRSTEPDLLPSGRVVDVELRPDTRTGWVTYASSWTVKVRPGDHCAATLRQCRSDSGRPHSEFVAKTFTIGLGAGERRYGNSQA